MRRNSSELTVDTVRLLIPRYCHAAISNYRHYQRHTLLGWYVIFRRKLKACRVIDFRHTGHGAVGLAENIQHYCGEMSY